MYILKNPFTYIIVIFGFIIIEHIGLHYNNYYALGFACSNAYYINDKPLETSACVKFLEQSH